ncbi:pentatricopeptide repeat-containing protein 1, mitochondrial [Bacillus rossius redtenbacheri]|uniref:pentatricopeptide repeat-containing protein 1, mitochondrial n=1 Tax=Bacillus rossius redtenbacheri TaxID=93214 RepID=UPI002FDCEC40
MLPQRCFISVAHLLGKVGLASAHQQCRSVPVHKFLAASRRLCSQRKFVGAEGGAETVAAPGSDPEVFGDLRGTRRTFEEAEGDESDKMDEERRNASQLRTEEYAGMIKALLQQKKLAEALDVLETRMLKEDFAKPPYYLFNLLIGACGRAGYTRKAFHLYNQLKKRGLHVSASVYTALFNSCANSPFPEEALKKAVHLWELIQEKGYQPNRMNYNAMIKAFGRCGDLASAFSVVDVMADQGLLPTDETFNFLLQACISDQDAGFRHALMVWRKLVQKGVRPEVYTFNLLLRSTRDCGLGDPATTSDALQALVDQGASGGPQLEAGPAAPGELVPGDLVQENRPNLLAPRPHLGDLVAVGEVTRPEDRLLLLGGCSGFLRVMELAGVEPNIKTFTLLLDVIPATITAEKALLSTMQHCSVRKDIDFFNMLIKKRSLRFDYENARKVLQLISEEKLSPDIVTFGVLSLGCKTKEEAQNFVREMTDAGFRPNNAILGAMMQQAVWRGGVDYVLEVMEMVLREQVRPNPRFMQHLARFHDAGRRRLAEGSKDDARSRRKFERLFAVFQQRFARWVKQADPDTEPAHPWEQFRVRKKA